MNHKSQGRERPIIIPKIQLHVCLCHWTYLLPGTLSIKPIDQSNLSINTMYHIYNIIDHGWITIGTYQPLLDFLKRSAQHSIVSVPHHGPTFKHTGACSFSQQCVGHQESDVWSQCQPVVQQWRGRSIEEKEKNRFSLICCSVVCWHSPEVSINVLSTQFSTNTLQKPAPDTNH